MSFSVHRFPGKLYRKTNEMRKTAVLISNLSSILHFSRWCLVWKTIRMWFFPGTREVWEKTIRMWFFPGTREVWEKTRSRSVQCFKEVNGCDYSQFFSTLLWNYTNRCDVGISNKSCFGQIFVIPKIVKSREIANIQKGFWINGWFGWNFHVFCVRKPNRDPPSWMLN